MRRFRKLWLVLAVTAIVGAILPGLSSADEAAVDGDQIGGVSISGGALEFGTVCAGTTIQKNVLFAVYRTSNGAPNIFRNGSSASVLITGVAGAGVSASMVTSSITFPSNWQTQLFNTLSASVTSTVTLTAGAPSTTFAGSVAYTASGVNANGNALARTTTLQVKATIVSCDTTAPTLHLPGGITAEATGPSGATISYTATADDAAPAHPTVSCNPSPGFFPLGTTMVTCSASDAAGNSATGSFGVTVLDTTEPSFSGIPANVVIEASGAAGAIVTYAAPTATDIVDGTVPVVCTPLSGSLIPLGTVTVVCSATDRAGNDASTSFTVTVDDITAPSLVVPASVAVEATSSAGADVIFEASATDAVDGPIVPTCDPASGSTFALGTTTVTCAATDDHDNDAATSFDVTVVDTTPPSLTVPASFTKEATGASGATVSFDVSAVDLVDGTVAVSCSADSGDVFPLGETVVTCSASDGEGNGESTAFTVTVVDTKAPNLSLPADVIEEATSRSNVVAYLASATDVVDGTVPVSCVPVSGSTFAVGTTIVSCEAKDARGNRATGSFSVTITDTTAPTVSVPDDIVAEATGPNGATVAFSPAADDLVDGDIAVECTPPPASTFALGTTTVRCSATDVAGNTGSDSFDVTVQDTTAPKITATPSDVTVEATGPNGAEVSFVNPSATDVVDTEVPVDCSPRSGSTFALDVDTTVACSATDDAGNTASSTFIVRVADTSGPMLTLPEKLIAEATGPGGAPVEFTPSANDIVDGVVEVVCTPPSATTFALGSTTVSCAATDLHDNPSSGTFDVEVVDTTKPTLTVPADITVEATGAAGAPVTYSASAEDIVDGSVTPTCDVPTGATFAIGETTVTCRATDAHNNTAIDSFTITVEDTTAPALHVPANITAEATSAAGTSLSYVATADDVVDGSVTPTCAPAPGSVFGLGTTVVHCSATDARGNTATQSFSITVQDTTAPDLTAPEAITAEATSAAGAVVVFSAEAVDIVDGALAVTCVPASGSRFALGSTEVVCKVIDAAGNIASAKFVVAVVDTTAPEIGDPSDLTAEATGPYGAVVEFTNPPASDLVDGEVSTVCEPPSGSTFSLGSTVVTCAATDEHGNSSSKSFAITIDDTTSPVLTLPDDITAEATGADGAAVTFTATAFDLVDGSLAVACTQSAGSTFGFGTTTVGCSVSDAHDNASSGSFTVTVEDTTAPVLTVPENITAEATGPSGATISYTAWATDVVDGAVTPTCGPLSGTTFALGTTTVTCTATDSHGNAATATFSVTVRDTIAPTLHLPSAMQVTATSASGAWVSWASSAGDVVDTSLAVACTPGSPAMIAPGHHTVQCASTDDSGNTGIGTFTVSVRFDLSGGLLPPVNPNVLNTVKSGSTVPLKWQVRNPDGGWITSTAIVSHFSLTEISCRSLATELAAPVDGLTTTGGTALRYDSVANQFIQNWQTPKQPGRCYRVDVVLIGGIQTLSANFQLK